MGYRSKTDFLTATPSLFSGAGRLFDLYGQFDAYNESANGTEADAKAMASDWSIVGDDIAAAMSEFEVSEAA